MKNLSVIIAIAAFLIVNVYAAENESSKRRTVVVSGYAESENIANEATFRFTVEGVGPNLDSAVASARRQTSVIVAGLMELGLDKKDISTLRFNSGENRGDKAFLSSKRDYKAVIETIVKVDSIALLEGAIVFVSSFNPFLMSSIAFSLKDEHLVRRDVRRKAVQAAKSKAEDMAAELGFRVGKVLYVNVDANDYNNNFIVRGSRGYTNEVLVDGLTVTDQYLGGLGASFSAQTIDVNAKVQVEFEIAD